jgi:hypothetical protein
MKKEALIIGAEYYLRRDGDVRMRYIGCVDKDGYDALVFDPTTDECCDTYCLYDEEDERYYEMCKAGYFGVTNVSYFEEYKQKD